MLNCKDECEGWKYNYPYGTSADVVSNPHPWRYCHFCGAKLVDEEAELRKELGELISQYNDNPAFWKSRDIANALISKYNITRKGD